MSRSRDAAGAPLLTVAHTQRALEDLARAARARSNAKIVAVTGSAGKTTTKEMLRLAFGALGPTHASAASYNNHWGVPLSRSPRLPRDAEYGVFEIGMNHFGEIRTLVVFRAPACGAGHHHRPGASGILRHVRSHRRRQIGNLRRPVAGRRGADSRRQPLCRTPDRARAKQRSVAHILRFGSEPGDARLLSFDESGEGMRVKADILGKPVDCRDRRARRCISPRMRWARCCVAPVGRRRAERRRRAQGFYRPQRPRRALQAGGVEVIDESYNANPASMAAALALLAKAPGRRVAVLGDMLEMGPDGAAHHAGLAPALEAAHADLVFLCGPLMKVLVGCAAGVAPHAPMRRIPPNWRRSSLPRCKPATRCWSKAPTAAACP